MLPEAAAGQQQTARAGLTGPAASRTPAWTPSTLPREQTWARPFGVRRRTVCVNRAAPRDVYCTHMYPSTDRSPPWCGTKIV
jgi:hypothetical protein